jgi:uncharacterized membrane protein YgdD (TMEM256/DUF423 family)
MDDRRRAGMWLALAGLDGAIATIAGALGAHGGAPEARALIQTGAHYQLVHALALAVVALLMRTRGGRLIEASGVAFVIGSALFSGGLYLTAAGFPSVTILVPFGGASFITGWLLIAAAGLRDWRRPRL